MAISRRIVYISGTRADFGLMTRSLQKMSVDPRLQVSVLVTGMHLNDEYGATWRDIEDAGIAIAARVPIDVTTRSRASMSVSVGQAITGLTTVLDHLRPDAVLLLGDRGEMLAGAISCLHLGVPFFHIHGGERSGTVDEPMRHAISKMATWHLVTTPQCKRRLIRMGERTDSIAVVGAPGLDGLVDSAAHVPDDLLRGCGMTVGAPYILALFHPVVQQAESSEVQTKNLAEAMQRTGIQVLWLAPNSDAGSVAILELAKSAMRVEHQGSFVVHLTRPQFATAMKHCAVMVGNSSAGIIEAASFGTPVVNVGERQHLRERNRNVIDCGNTLSEISDALGRALAYGRFTAENVYGDGQSARRIVRAVAETQMDVQRLNKVNTY